MENQNHLCLLEQLLSLKESQSKYIHNLHNQFGSKLSQKVPFNLFLQRLSSSKTNSDKVAQVQEYFDFVPFDASAKNKFQKNSEISTALRNFGNNAYQKKCFVDAVRLYNLALLFAPPGHPENALAYGNRSAALKSMGLLEEAIKDVELAISLSYGPGHGHGYHDEYDKLTKLIERKQRFEAELAARFKNPSYERMLRDEISKRNAFYQEIFTLKSPNTLAPSLEDSVDIVYSFERGRHLVANRDIPIGATVMVETPFVAVLKNALNWDVDHCHHCFKRNLRCIPCPQCVFTLYCSEKCRKEARDYHQYECPCLPELHFISNDYMAGNLPLAFKLVCLLGPKKILKLFSERTPAQEYSYSIEKYSADYNSIEGSDPQTGIYDPNSYRAISSLMATRIEEGYYVYLIALTLSRSLELNSYFFDSIKTPTTTTPFGYTEFGNLTALINFVAELIVHNLETSRRNSFGLREYCGVDGIKLRTSSEWKPNGKGMLDTSYRTLATGTFATGSLANHSCLPNVARFTGKTWGRMAVVALKPLKRGEEILVTYGPLYGGNGGDERNSLGRQASLKPYEFFCNCPPCKYDWPGIHELALSLNIQVQPAFCCPLCSSKFIPNNNQSSEYERSKDFQLSPDFRCNSCKVRHSRQRIENAYDSHCGVLRMCHELIDTNYPLNSVAALKSALLFFETHVCSPNYFALIASQLYRQAVQLTILFAEPEP